jgi:hypothetical protein
MTPAVLGMAAIFVAGPAWAGYFSSQPKSSPEYAVAREVERRGCRVKEEDLLKIFQSKGLSAGDFQAIVYNLYNTGELELEADNVTVKMKDFGKCR